MVLKADYGFLREVSKKPLEMATQNSYPFCLPAVTGLKKIKLHPKVTFFIGENGSGKSTLIEGIAIAAGFNPEGGSKNFNFATHSSHSCLSDHLCLGWDYKRPRDGYFLRAESFYNVASFIDDLDQEEGGGMPLIDSYGGVSLHHQSHGESFMALMLNRFGGQGLYILDEPEAALSPTRQMAMLTRMHDLIKLGSQFIIATHSPIIMAYPDACIYNIEKNYKVEKYHETEHYQLMHNFLNKTDTMLHVLLGRE